MKMRRAEIFTHGVCCGLLFDLDEGGFCVVYDELYRAPPISLTMPLSQKTYEYKTFPPFFDGLLPEGVMLESLLNRAKIDRYDFFAQLMLIRGDLVGSITVEEIT